MPQSQSGSQKPPDAQCPMCGSALGKSPMGQQVLQKVSGAMAQKARGGPQRPPSGPGMSAPQARPPMRSMGASGPQGAPRPMMPPMMRPGGR